MHIERIRALAGPNVFDHRPMLAMRLHLDALTAKESYEVPGFIDRLLATLPGLHEHHCSRERPGGFVERLREGTYLGHVVEHVTIELSHAAGIPVNRGKTVYAGTEGVYDVVVRYTSEPGMRRLLEVATELVDALVADDPYPLEDRLAEVRQVVAETELGPSTRAIVEAAERRMIPWTRLSEGSLIQLGYGKHRRFIQAAMTDGTSAIGVDIASDKPLSKALLERAFLPVPRGTVAYDEEEAVAALAQLGGPVVVKPADGNQGKGVSVGLETPEQVEEAFRIASAYGRRVIVEEQFRGHDYRVLVVNGKLAAASERRPCHIVGDGRRTIAALIDAANQDSRRGAGHEKPLTRIAVDHVVHAHLAATGRTLDDVPAPGERVFLRQNANLSQGGTARDVTDCVHPEVASICERAARIVGLDVCGVDLVLEDIAEPIVPGRGGIVELNAVPGLRMHLHPSEGPARDVGAAIVEMLYPPGTPARVPIFAITGTNGKTTVTRLIAHIVASMGCTVGMTTTDGIEVDGTRIVRGDTTGPASAQVILSDPAVEVAVLETARGGIVRRGLGYDWADVAVLTNIGPDHIGQDGIESVEDLVHIKSLVAERVIAGGTLVLNADDEHLVRLMQRPDIRDGGAQVVLFSLHPHNLLVERHVSEGHTAFFERDGWLVEATGPDTQRIIRTDAIPLTMGGRARFQVANVLAATAACRAHGIPRSTVAAALERFDASCNSGRAGLYRLGEAYVLIDYGHNPKAVEAICRMLARWTLGGKRIGIIGAPGDRQDALLAQTAQVAACGFDRIVVKEDHDRRGRRRGEVARLLANVIAHEAPALPYEIVLDECEALSQELDRLEPGDVVVLFYEKLDPILDLLRTRGAVAVQQIEHVEEAAASRHRLGARALRKQRRLAKRRVEASNS